MATHMAQTSLSRCRCRYSADIKAYNPLMETTSHFEKMEVLTLPPSPPMTKIAVQIIFLSLRNLFSICDIKSDHLLFSRRTTVVQGLLRLLKALEANTLPLNHIFQKLNAKLRSRRSYLDINWFAESKKYQGKQTRNFTKMNGQKEVNNTSLKLWKKSGAWNLNLNSYYTLSLLQSFLVFCTLYPQLIVANFFVWSFFQETPKFLFIFFLPTLRGKRLTFHAH